MAGSEHGLQAGEVGAATWDNQAGMKEFAI